MKIKNEDIEELHAAIIVLWNDRKDMETMTMRDVLHDIFCYCKKNSFEERMKFAKKRINGELTYKKLKVLTIEQLERRRIFEKWWLKNKKKTDPDYHNKHKARNNAWAQRQRDEKTPQHDQINANSRMRWEEYNINRISKGVIDCVIHKQVCNRMTNHKKYHHTDGCPRSEDYTLYKKICVPNDSVYIQDVLEKIKEDAT
jgi:hypothetical protein